MRAKVAIVVAVLSVSSVGVAESADQSPNGLAPGQSRSIFNQGAVGRLRQMFGGSGDETTTAAEATPGPTTTVTRSPARSPRTTARPQMTTGRSSPRTASRTGRPGFLWPSREAATSSHSPLVEEIPSSSTAPTTSANAASQSSNNEQATSPALNAESDPATITVARQSAVLSNEAADETATTRDGAVIRLAQRATVPREIATLESQSHVPQSTRSPEPAAAPPTPPVEIEQTAPTPTLDMPPTTPQLGESFSAAAAPAEPTPTLVPQPEVKHTPVVVPAMPRSVATTQVVPTPTPTINQTSIPQSPVTSVSVMLSAEIIGPQEIHIGNTGLFKVRLRNDGDALASDVHAQMRTGESVLSTLSAGAIAARSTVEVEIAFTPDRTGTLLLHATASSSDGAQADADGMVLVGKPELTLAIAGPPQLNHGESRSYTAILTNSGNIDATNVNVAVMLAGGLAQSTPAGTVPAGQSRRVSFDLKPETAGQVPVDAVATADGNVQAVAHGALTVLKPEVQLALEGPAELRVGEKVVYTLVVSNRGNAAVENIVVNVLFGESSLAGIYSGTLAAKQEERISFGINPSQAGAHALRAEAIGAGDIQATASSELQVAE